MCTYAITLCSHTDGGHLFGIRRHEKSTLSHLIRDFSSPKYQSYDLLRKLKLFTEKIETVTEKIEIIFVIKFATKRLNASTSDPGIRLKQFVKCREELAK